MNKTKTGKKNYLRVARKVLSLLLALNLTTSVVTAASQNYEEKYNQTKSYLSDLDDTMTYLKKYGIETTKLKCGTIYVNSYKSNGIKNIIVYSNKDFKEYIDNYSPTFDDVKNVLEKNTKINEYFKTLIKTYIDKVKKNNPNADLSVFYCNLKKLEIECTTEEELSKLGQNIAARFDARNCKILYLTGMSEGTFEHELSHLFTECYLYIDDNTLIHKTFSLAIPIIEDNKITIKFSLSAALEGATDLFTISNNPNYKLGSYESFAKQITELINMTSENIHSTQEKGIIYMLDNLYEYGISDPYELLYEMDDEFYSLLNKSPKLVKSA